MDGTGGQMYVRHRQRVQFLQGVGLEGVGGNVVVSRDHQQRDPGLRQALDPALPFPLKGWRRHRGAVGIAREQHQLHLFAEGGVHDLIQ